MNEGGWEDNITTSNILKLHYPKKKRERIYTKMLTVVFQIVELRQFYLCLFFKKYKKNVLYHQKKPSGNTVLKLCS